LVTRDLLGYVVVPTALIWAVTSLDLPLPLAAEPYAEGTTPLFLDRGYVDTQRDSGLAGYRVIRIPRHLRFEIELTLSQPATLVRLLTDRNDNRVFADWEPAPGVRVNVPGRSCSLTRAVERRVGPGSLRLPPGGPVTASPLLIATAGEFSARTLRSINKLLPGRKGGWTGILSSNRRKLAALAAGWVAWAVLLRLFLRVWDARG